MAHTYPHRRFSWTTRLIAVVLSLTLALPPVAVSAASEDIKEDFATISEAYQARCRRCHNVPRADGANGP